VRTQTGPTLGVILAGGASRRFGSDKAQAHLGGKPLLDWVAGRALPQVDLLLVNTGDQDSPTAGLERLGDDAPGEGPMAGLLAALRAAEQRGFARIASFACDTPFFPHDLVMTLHETLEMSSADVVLARHRATSHPIFGIWRTNCSGQLATAFAAGCRSLRDVPDHLTVSVADFPDGDGPDGDPFFNINTREELALAERWLAAK
jgi:molybdopterin-guanine dinucleotide biosynthesis protein A